MPRVIKLFLLSIRDLFTSAGPSIALAVGLLAAAYYYLDPQPPSRVMLATGPAGSAYAGFGSRYATALRGDGVEVELVPTEGAADNLRLLREGKVDVAFVRGGIADPVADQAAGLLSLGSLFYEPLWVFYRKGVLPPDEQDRAAAVLGPAHRPSSRAARAAPARSAGPRRLEALVQFRGLRVNVDRAGSGVPEIIGKMLEANRLGGDDLAAVDRPDPSGAA